MRNLLTLLCLIATLTLTAQFSRNTVRGNGDVKTEKRNLSGFEGVSVCCDINLELKEGAFDVRIEAESNILEYVTTKVNGDRLDIGFADNTNLKKKEDVTVYVTLPSLDYVAASSSAEARCQSTFRGEKLRADCSSGARVSIDYEGDDLRANASSGGSLEMTGRSDRLTAHASSGGKVRGKDFVATRARCEASSGGGVSAQVRERLDAEASSGGRVRYAGQPTDVSKDTSSGGSIRRGF